LTAYHNIRYFNSIKALTLIRKNVANTDKPIIEVNHLVKRYKKASTNSVDDISFSVKQGEFFAFLGPNGAGKTTTISILTTTLVPSSGSVTVAGHNVVQQAEAVRRNIGIIFQNPSLDVQLTAEQNIRLHVSLYGLYGYAPTYKMMPKAYRDRVTELATILCIHEDMFKPLKTFSGGMKRKLEIVRSLMHNPKVLFLDEPTSGLDASSRTSLWEYLQEVRRTQNTTIFLTTHYLEEAEGADRVCIVNHGKIKLLDTPSHMKQLLLDRFVIIDSKDRTALRREVDRFHPEDTKDGSLKISFTTDTPQAILQAIKAPLTQLQVITPSLEDAYVAFTNGQGVKA
jgi:ABC-2 type transport system ATP-binding protein